MTTSGRTGCRGVQGPLLEVDEAEIIVEQADEPNALVDFVDAEALGGEEVRDVDALAMHADAAAMGDQHVAVVQRVAKFGQPIISARRGGIDLGRTFHSERLMPALPIKFLAEGVEAGRLRQDVIAWRSGRFPLQRQMHALVAAVLLRLAGFDALDPDAKPQPPDRQPGEVEESIGAGEGNPVVGVDRLRQPALAAELLEGGQGPLLAHRFHRFTHQEVAGGIVDDGQGIAVSTVAKLELAREVDTPQLIRRPHQAKAAFWSRAVSAGASA